jgi:hypothetical protein
MIPVLVLKKSFRTGGGGDGGISMSLLGASIAKGDLPPQPPPPPPARRLFFSSSSLDYKIIEVTACLACYRMEMLFTG